MSAPATPDSVILRAEHLGRTVHDKILVQDANFELQREKSWPSPVPAARARLHCCDC